MSKIQAKSGDSLADVYDVVGSIAGVEELLSKDVNLVHEMGRTIFSERLSGTIFRLVTADLAQNVGWDIPLTPAPNVPARLLNIQVLADVAGRVTDAQVSLTGAQGSNDIDMPFFIWDTNDLERSIRFVRVQTVFNMIALIPAAVPQVPSLLIGAEQPNNVGAISFRGTTSGFGAGTVTLEAIVYLGFPIQRGVSSRGLPLPGW